MKVWFLVYVLSTGQGSEMHLAIQMPDQSRCETVGQSFTYAAEIYVGPPEPFHADLREEREVEDYYCEWRCADNHITVLLPDDEVRCIPSAEGES